MHHPCLHLDKALFKSLERLARSVKRAKLKSKYIPAYPVIPSFDIRYQDVLLHTTVLHYWFNKLPVELWVFLALFKFDAVLVSRYSGGKHQPSDSVTFSLSLFISVRVVHTRTFSFSNIFSFLSGSCLLCVVIESWMCFCGANLHWMPLVYHCRSRFLPLSFARHSVFALIGDCCIMSNTMTNLVSSQYDGTRAVEIFHVSGKVSETKG